jgi:hypothetical protein
MRWIERLWRDDQRIKATPTRIAASLAEGVTRSTNVLRIRLQEEGFGPADHKHFESEACILECLLFEWSLRDIVVTVEFGRHTDAVRQAVARRLSISLQALGTLAWRRIADTAEPSERMTMFLAMRATAELQALRGLGKRHSVMTPPRSFLSAPSEE